MGDSAVRLGLLCFTAQLQSPIIYAYAHEQQMLVMLLSSIQPHECTSLLFMDQVSVSAHIHTHTTVSLPSCSRSSVVEWLLRTMRGKTGNLIKGSSLGDVPSVGMIVP